MQTNNVPCNGCTLCCKNDTIVLHPQYGDDPSQYQTVPTVNQLTGEQVLMLDHKPNGDCIYLENNQCSIYEKRPVICKTFDCRRMYLGFTKAERLKMLKMGWIDKEKIEAGKKRLNTLPQSERQEERRRKNETR